MDNSLSHEIQMLAQRMLDDQGYIIVSSADPRCKGDVVHDAQILNMESGRLESMPPLVVVADATEHEHVAQAITYGLWRMGVPLPHFYRCIAE